MRNAVGTVVHISYMQICHIYIISTYSRNALYTHQRNKTKMSSFSLGSDDDFCYSHIRSLHRFHQRHIFCGLRLPGLFGSFIYLLTCGGCGPAQNVEYNDDDGENNPSLCSFIYISIFCRRKQGRIIRIFCRFQIESNFRHIKHIK